jgi:hypothetical protein
LKDIIERPVINPYTEFCLCHTVEVKIIIDYGGQSIVSGARDKVIAIVIYA